MADHLGLLPLAVLFEKSFEEWRSVEVILDRALAAAGNNDDVLDAGSHAFFSNILNLRLIDNGQHFFGLRFGGRQKARAQAGGRQNGFADFAQRSGVRRRLRVVWSHSFSREIDGKKMGSIGLRTVAARQWIVNPLRRENATNAVSARRNTAHGFATSGTRGAE